jgi:hypothetical protein
VKSRDVAYVELHCRRYSDWGTGWTVWISNPDRGERLLASPKRPVTWVPEFFPGAKIAGA